MFDEIFGNETKYIVNCLFLHCNNLYYSIHHWDKESKINLWERENNELKERINCNEKERECERNNKK